MSHLRAQLGPEKNYVTHEDFLEIMRAIAQEDEEWFSAVGNVEDECSMKFEVSFANIFIFSAPSLTPMFQTGDKVELADGYERFGDATKGPLQPLDRGTIIDLQQGSDNEM